MKIKETVPNNILTIIFSVLFIAGVVTIFVFRHNRNAAEPDPNTIGCRPGDISRLAALTLMFGMLAVMSCPNVLIDAVMRLKTVITKNVRRIKHFIYETYGSERQFRYYVLMIIAIVILILLAYK